VTARQVGGTGGHAAPDRDVRGPNPGENVAIKVTHHCTEGIIMFKDSAIIAVLPAKDINRAKDFYRDKLGLEPAESLEAEGLMYRCGNGTGFLVYQTENAGTAKNTQMGWGTDDLERDVEELQGRGVVFEDYDQPGLKTENGIATAEWGKSAWFLDSEGNILNISQRA
jgi:catechol 2,3-dioxygenase-like lactoylglutathione lyase family enzyme